MNYKIQFSDKAYKQLDKLDKSVAKNIINFLRHKVLVLDDPKQIGKPLAKTMQGLWRYRIGKYRIICDIKDSELIVLVLAIGHRKQIYQ